MWPEINCKWQFWKCGCLKWRCWTCLRWMWAPTLDMLSLDRDIWDLLHCSPGDWPQLRQWWLVIGCSAWRKYSSTAQPMSGCFGQWRQRGRDHDTIHLLHPGSSLWATATQHGGLSPPPPHRTAAEALNAISDVRTFIGWQPISGQC